MWGKKQLSFLGFMKSSNGKDVGDDSKREFSPTVGLCPK